MKRRSFILLSASGLTALVLPSLGCNHVDANSAKILQLPNQLSHIVDAQTIREIGIAYRKQLAVNVNKDQLMELLLTDNAGKPVASSDTTILKTVLNNKIKSDFEKGNTLTLKGWILSETEARQCAVYSLIQQ